MMQPKSVMARQARGAARVARVAGRMAAKRNDFVRALDWAWRAQDADEKAAYYERA
jgi:hypothetical protein